MNRELAMAYDLLHQVQSLSWEEKNSAGGQRTDGVHPRTTRGDVGALP